MATSRPDPTAVAALLRERWTVPAAIGLAVEEGQREGQPRLVAHVDRPGTGRRPRERISVDVTYLRGGDAAAAHDLLVDALDALIGTLFESELAYRELPTGSDVTFGDAIFWVDVLATRPDLEKDADAWLNGN